MDLYHLHRSIIYYSTFHALGTFGPRFFFACTATPRDGKLNQNDSIIGKIKMISNSKSRSNPKIKME